MNKIIKNKINKGVVLAIIILAFGLSLTIMLKYKTEGETNMPFNLKKILIISSAEAKTKSENPENYKWNLDINQYNDIYIELEKNEKNDSLTYIEKITLENFSIDSKNNENVEIYMPNSTEEKLFSYEENFKVNGALTYNGANENNEKTLSIANQGGTILFRILNKNISEYQSNDGDEIEYDGRLLKKSETDIENTKITASFDIIIQTDANKYKGRITINLPTGDIKEEGVTRQTIENFESIVFKRM